MRSLGRLGECDFWRRAVSWRPCEAAARETGANCRKGRAVRCKSAATHAGRRHAHLVVGWAATSQRVARGAPGRAKSFTVLNNPFFKLKPHALKKHAHPALLKCMPGRGPTTSRALSARARSKAHSRLDLHLGQGARLFLTRSVGHVGWASSWAAPVLVRVGVRVW